MCVCVCGCDCVRGRLLLGSIGIRTEVKQPIDALVRVQRIRIVIVVRRIDGHKGDIVAEVVRANVVEESIEALQRDTAAVAVGIAVSHAGRQAVAVMAVRLMGISVGASASDAAIAAAAATTAAATAVVALRDGSELHLQ